MSTKMIEIFVLLIGMISVGFTVGYIVRDIKDYGKDKDIHNVLKIINDSIKERNNKSLENYKKYVEMRNEVKRLTKENEDLRESIKEIIKEIKDEYQDRRIS